MSDTDLVFHLLDIQARDIRIESEQEDVREVIYESNSDDDDDEIKSKRKIKKSKQLNQQREFVIHLFGATESGQVVRCDVTGSPFYSRDRPSQLVLDAKERQSEGCSLADKAVRI